MSSIVSASCSVIRGISSRRSFRSPVTRRPLDDMATPVLGSTSDVSGIARIWMSICKDGRAATYITEDGLVTDMTRHDMKSYQTI